MANKLPTKAAGLEKYEDDLIKSLEIGRSRGCDPHTIQRKSDLYAEAVGELLAQAPDGREHPDTQAVDSYLHVLEKSYLGWKSVNRVFEDTIRLAYTHSVPRRNLLVDQAFSDLLQSVGEPLAERYINLKSRWRNHLTDHPWDAYKESTPSHLDSDRMDDCLNALVRGDDLDVEDALNDLTGGLRHAFIDFLENNPDSIVDIESGLWKRPEILIAGDFWQRGRKRRVFDILSDKTTPRFASAFSTIRSFFELDRSPGAAYSPRAVADLLQAGAVECASCHDVHDTVSNGAGGLLVIDNANSALCTTCHNK